jgi:hypothetical protein
VFCWGCDLYLAMTDIYVVHRICLLGGTVWNRRKVDVKLTNKTIKKFLSRRLRDIDYNRCKVKRNALPHAACLYKKLEMSISTNRSFRFFL